MVSTASPGNDAGIQGFVHIDQLAELYRLAVKGVILARMLGMTGRSSAGFRLTRRMPVGLARRLQASGGP